MFIDNRPGSNMPNPMSLYRLGRIVIATTWGGNPVIIANECTIPNGFKHAISTGCHIEGLEVGIGRRTVLTFPQQEYLTFEFRDTTEKSNINIYHGCDNNLKTRFANVWGSTMWITNDNMPTQDVTTIYL